MPNQRSPTEEGLRETCAPCNIRRFCAAGVRALILFMGLKGEKAKRRWARAPPPMQDLWESANHEIALTTESPSRMARCTGELGRRYKRCGVLSFALLARFAILYTPAKSP